MDDAQEKTALPRFGTLRRVGGRGAVLSLLRRIKGQAKNPRRTNEQVTRTFAAGTGHPDKARLLRGYRDQAMREGTDSIVGYLPQRLAEKAMGRDKVRGAMWKYVQRPALEADTAVGHVLSKVPVAGRAFKVKEQVPWGKDLHRTVERSSALGPLTKLRSISEPLFVGVGLTKAINNVSEIAKRRREGHMGEEAQTSRHDPDLLEKAASAMLRLDTENRGHTKRAQALRLLYKQAEMGMADLPQTYDELEEKLAALAQQDLVVFEKALELTGGNVKLGVLATSDITALNPSEQFMATVLGDEI